MCVFACLTHLSLFFFCITGFPCLVMILPYGFSYLNRVERRRKVFGYSFSMIEEHMLLEREKEKKRLKIEKIRVKRERERNIRESVYVWLLLYKNN